MLRAVHLLDDLSFGGVTRALAIFDHPALARRMTSNVIAVDPRARVAPALAADVIVIHFTPRWNALPFLAALRLRNRRARIVHVEHSYTGAWADLHVTRPHRFRALLGLWWRACDAVVAVSQGQRAWLEDCVGRRGLRVIEPWSGTNGLDLVPALARGAQAPLTLAAYGRFAPQKGFDTLIAAMQRLKGQDVTLLLGGFGPEEAALRALARGLDSVRFVGRVEDVGGFLAQADVVVVPSRWEAFGQVAAESKLAGRPVLLANVDGLPEQAVTPGWIADCTSAQSLAEAIARIDRAGLPAVGARNRAAMAGAEQQRVQAWLALIADLAPALRPAAPAHPQAPAADRGCQCR
jgi:glycosyltransferase involved in cell wall biosynthesis